MLGTTSSRVRGGAGIVALAAGLGAASVVRLGRDDDVAVASLDQRVLAAALGAAGGGFVAAALARLVRSRVEVPWVLAASVLMCIGALLAIESTNDTTSNPSGDPTDMVADVAVEDGSSPPGGATPNPLERAERAGQTTFDIDVGGTIVLLVALALLVTAAIFFGRRTETRAVGRDGVYLVSDLAPEVDTPVPEVDDHVRAAFRDALAQLELDDTPSARIRAAYAAMLARLGESGLPRHPSEPPRRYVERCLVEATLPAGATRELLALFELARFSTQPLDTADVDLARAALGRVLDRMTAAPA